MHDIIKAMAKTTTVIQLKHYDHIYTIELNRTVATLSDMIDELVKPLLLAAGFHPDTVEDLLGDGVAGEKEGEG